MAQLHKQTQATKTKTTPRPPQSPQPTTSTTPPTSTQRPSSIQSSSSDTNLYISDAYLDKHPTLFQEHSDWKLTFILPMLDELITRHHPITPAHSSNPAQPFNLLDVGGGAGLILRDTASHLRDCHHLTVTKNAIDLSPGMLKQQQQNNPDLHHALAQDITHTDLPDKSIHLTLLIDVLEHLPDPAAALSEIARFSKYALLKVPLEKHLVHFLSNCLNRGRTRQTQAASLGHVNFYTARTLTAQLEKHLGSVLTYRFCNTYDFSLKNESHILNAKLNLANRFCRAIHPLSPRLASLIYTDFLVVLVRCHAN